MLAHPTKKARICLVLEPSHSPTDRMACCRPLPSPRPVITGKLVILSLNGSLRNKQRLYITYATQLINNVIESFDIRLYGVKDSYTKSVNVARQHVFALLKRPFQSIPQTREVLITKIKRAVYQAGQAWQGSGRQKANLSRGLGLGSKTRKWDAVWTDEPAIWSGLRSLHRSWCITGRKTQRCTCRRFLLPCAKYYAETRCK